MDGRSLVGKFNKDLCLRSKAHKSYILTAEIFVAESVS